MLVLELVSNQECIDNERTKSVAVVAQCYCGNSNSVKEIVFSLFEKRRYPRNIKTYEGWRVEMETREDLLYSFP